MTSFKNDRLIRALLRQPVDRTPVWMMRQAGRYLPEYRKLRAEVPNFMTFCKTPELACEATLQPVQRFALDAAIIFSDILVIPDAMGMQLEFIEGDGPKIHNPIQNAADIKKLVDQDILERLDYVIQAMKLVAKELDGKVPLIGFAGSPWTVATYMIEGGSSKIFKQSKQMVYSQSQLLKYLLQKITDATIIYLNAQIEAGAQAIMVFDTWGGILSTAAYQEFSLAYMQKIAQGIKREYNGQKIPLTFFTKGGGQWLEMMAKSGCDALGLDWTVDIASARQRVGDQVALQGNLDPMNLYATTEQIEQAVIDIIDGFGPYPGHVFNLGHGIDKDTPVESVQAMLEAVQRYGRHTAKTETAAADIPS